MKNIEHFPDKYIDEIDEEINSNYFTPVWKEILSKIRIDNLLDVGCGNGIFSSIVKKETGCNLVGVDGNKYALEKASSDEVGFDEVRLFIHLLAPTNSASNPVLKIMKCF